MRQRQKKKNRNRQRRDECIWLNLCPPASIYAAARRLGWALVEAAVPSWRPQHGRRVAAHVVLEASPMLRLGRGPRR